MRSVRLEKSPPPEREPFPSAPCSSVWTEGQRASHAATNRWDLRCCERWRRRERTSRRGHPGGLTGSQCARRSRFPGLHAVFPATVLGEHTRWAPGVRTIPGPKLVFIRRGHCDLLARSDSCAAVSVFRVTGSVVDRVRDALPGADSLTIGCQSLKPRHTWTTGTSLDETTRFNCSCNNVVLSRLNTVPALMRARAFPDAWSTRLDGRGPTLRRRACSIAALDAPAPPRWSSSVSVP